MNIEPITKPMLDASKSITINVCLIGNEHDYIRDARINLNI
jgi:hypothetical protein